MAITGTTQLSNSVKPLYDAEYLIAANGVEYHDQFTAVKKVLGGQRGSTVNFTIFELLDPATTALAQASDIAGVAAADSEVVITLAEYGNAITRTNLLKATAYNDTDKALAAVMGINRARSLDIIARDVVQGGTNVMYAGGVTARTSLTSANLVSWDFLTELVSRAQAWNVPDNKGMYACIAHPLLLADIMNLGPWQSVKAYQDQEALYAGEVGELAGIRFIKSYNAKAFLGGGATAQAAGSTTAALAAGDTSVTLNDTCANLGLATGDFVVIGTLEASNAEQVQITNASASTITFRGMGNTQGNFGCRYAHASGVAVTEAETVFPITLLGPQSISKAYSSITGPKGQLRMTGPFDVLGRFENVGWLHIVGYARTSEKFLMRGEVTGRLNPIGPNQF